jgi:Ca-activated chloride channel family protein
MRAIGAVWLVMLSVSGWGQAAAPGSAATPAPASSNSADAEQTQGAVTTLKVVTRLVAISAVVKSKDGESKTGLTKDDFVLKQDGKEVPIRYFSQGSDLPLTIALMVDTSGSQRTFIGDESLASDVFFATMLGRKEDRAMLVEFGNRVRLLQGMTNSASALHLALSGLSPHAALVGGTLLNDAVYVVAKDVLAKETGRKAMVILTDGGDNGSRKSLAEAVEQAQRGDVQIYSILYSAWAGFSDSTRPSGVDPGQEALQKFSESTGGRVFTVSRTMGLREIFAEIAQELRLQYELGYTPPGDTQPNSYHKLELKAKDKKLSVQARKGFFAPP